MDGDLDPRDRRVMGWFQSYLDANGAWVSGYPAGLHWFMNCRISGPT
jgi:hypothetical protein